MGGLPTLSAFLCRPFILLFSKKVTGPWALCAGLFILLFPFLPALGETGLESVVLQLPDAHGFRFAGYYAAREKGYYREAGLSVSIVQGPAAISVAEELYHGSAQYGVMEPGALVHKEQGIPLVLLSSVFQQSPWRLVVRATSDIMTVADLAGKRVVARGNWGPLHAALLQQEIPLNRIRFVHSDTGAQDLAAGRVDALAGNIADVGWALKKAGVGFRIIGPVGPGGGFYGDSLFTIAGEALVRPARVNRFIAASLRGWDYALAHPGEVGKLIQEYYPCGGGLPRVAHDAQVVQHMVLPELIPLGQVSPERWQAMADTYITMGVLEPGFSMDGFFFSRNIQKGKPAGQWVLPVMTGGLVFGALLIFWLHNGGNSGKKQPVVTEDRGHGFRRIMDSASEIAIYGCDEAMEVIYWNASCEKQYGYTQSQAMGRSLETLIYPPGMIQKMRKRHEEWRLSGQPGPPGVVTFMDRNRDPVSVFSSAMTHLGETGMERFCFDIDMAPLQAAEREKLSAQRMAGEQKRFAVVGRVAGKIAHDFNNILGAIMGNAELTLLDCKDPEMTQVLTLIHEQTLKGKNLTQNLMAFAKDQELRQTFFEPGEKLNLVISLMRKELRGIRVNTHVEGNVPEILADPGMVENILVNLLQNAVHALSQTRDPRITIRCYSRRPYLYWEISDNGCGISAEHVETIYEPGFTLKGKKDITGAYRRHIRGTGYGMANVKKWVIQHKGDISVQTQEGVGSTFVVRLPVITRELTPLEKRALADLQIQKGKKILLVEDEVAISDIQRRVLVHEPCCHQVDVAATGQDALVLFEKNAYDLVSLDYMLPGALNGLAVYARIRETHPQVPVLFISGNLEFLESVKGLKARDPRVEHVSKPCHHKEYINAIHLLMERCARLLGG